VPKRVGRRGVASREGWRTPRQRPRAPQWQCAAPKTPATRSGSLGRSRRSSRCTALAERMLRGSSTRNMAMASCKRGPRLCRMGSSHCKACSKGRSCTGSKLGLASRWPARCHGTCRYTSRECALAPGRRSWQAGSCPSHQSWFAAPSPE